MEGKIISYSEKNKSGYVYGEDKIRYSFKKENIYNLGKRKVKIGNFVFFERKVTAVKKAAINIKMHKTFTAKKISENFHMRNSRPTGKIERWFRVNTAHYVSKKEALKALVGIAKELSCNALYEMQLKNKVILLNGVDTKVYKISAKAAIVTSEKACLTEKEESYLDSILNRTISNAEKTYEVLQGKEKQKDKNVVEKKDHTNKIIIGLVSLLLIGSGLLGYIALY
tara:strand:- start:49866 stop:50543 length:678 start_codon:yes stop_codon:yes gene_type:complete